MQNFYDLAHNNFRIIVLNILTFNHATKLR